MRYTTIIDITEIPAIYDNRNAREIYLTACLKCGYHDYDRDIWRRSYRQIASDLKLTLSATRHAINLLVKYNLLKKSPDGWIVKKYIEFEQITKRKTKKDKEQQQISDQREQEIAAHNKELAARAAEQQRVAAGGKTQYQMYIESLKEKAAAGDIEAAAALNRRKIKF